MNLYYPTKGPVIAPKIMVRKTRKLPVAGDVLVRIGARVEPDDVVARATIPGTAHSISVSSQLGVKPKAAAKLITRKVGDTVEAGDVIASKRQGLTRRITVTSPIAGTYTGYDAETGQATITSFSNNFELHAFVDGVVTEHIPYRGVVIDTPAALVRGIAGVGSEQHGVLQVGVTDAGDELLADQISARFAYSILLGGGTTTAAALHRAVEHSVRAVIVGSIPEAELRSFLGYPDGQRGWAGRRIHSTEGASFPPAILSPQPQPPPALTVIIIEGFGKAPMTGKTWELLASFDGQEVAVDGATRLGEGLMRPEIIIPLARASGAAAYETPAPVLAVRSLVRLLVPPFLGQTARVTALPPGKGPVASGITTQVAEVQFADSTSLLVPIANLEVLE